MTSFSFIYSKRIKNKNSHVFSLNDIVFGLYPLRLLSLSLQALWCRMGTLHQSALFQDDQADLSSMDYRKAEGRKVWNTLSGSGVPWECVPIPYLKRHTYSLCRYYQCVFYDMHNYKYIHCFWWCLAVNGKREVMTLSFHGTWKKKHFMFPFIPSNWLLICSYTIIFILMYLHIVMLVHCLIDAYNNMTVGEYIAFPFLYAILAL